MSKKLSFNNFKNVKMFNTVITAQDKNVRKQKVIQTVRKNILENKYQHSSKLSTYLFGVCKKVWLKIRRDEKQLVQLPHDYEYNSVDISTYNDSLDDIEKKLLVYVSQLRQECKDLLDARFWKDTTMNKIAEELGKNVQAVKMMSSRCIEKLYEMFEGKME